MIFWVVIAIRPFNTKILGFLKPPVRCVCSIIPDSSANSPLPRIVLASIFLGNREAFGANLFVKEGLICSSKKEQNPTDAGGDCDA